MPNNHSAQHRPSSTEEDTTPRWARSSPDAALPRLSRGSHRRRRLHHHHSQSFPSLSASSIVAQVQKLSRQLVDHGLGVLAWYIRLPRLQQILLGGGVLVLGALGLVALLYTSAFFRWLGPVADKWRRLPGGWLINFALVFVTAFPPVIGYATATTVAGFVWGFPLGWPIAAAACTLGSLCAFVASRTVLGGFVDRCVGRDPRFVALAHVMRTEGLLYLTAVRFCPLPFSLSNGFFATIPSITPLAFTISTALSSVKLLIHVFIGSRLAVLFERGDEMTARDKIVNWVGMGISGLVGLVVGLIIYRRTMDRAAVIAREQEAAAGDAEQAGGYIDAEGALLDPEDAASIMSDDDLSMWDDGDEVNYDQEEGG